MCKIKKTYAKLNMTIDKKVRENVKLISTEANYKTEQSQYNL